MSKKPDSSDSSQRVSDEVSSSVSQIFTNLNIQDSTELTRNSNSQRTLNNTNSGDQIIYNSALLYDSRSDSVNTITSATILNTPLQQTNKVISSAKMTSSSLVPQGISILPNNNDNNIQESPKLLATSVGREVGGRLLPSSSTISLLSLNGQQNDPTSPLLSTVNSNNRPVHKNVNQQRLSNSHQKQQLSSTQLSYLSGVSTSISQPINRRVSFTSPGVSGSNSLYQNIPSRPITISRTGSFSTGHPGPIQITRPTSSSHYYHHQHNPSSSSTSLHQQQQNHVNGNQNSSNVAPNSPLLDPTSLANSPSNFYLSHSSPPGSFKSQTSTYIQTAKLSSANPNISKNYPHILTTSNLSTTSLQNQNPQQLHLQTTPMYQISRQTSIPNSIGGKSPDLLPSSLIMPPMTPLNLNTPTDILISSPEVNSIDSDNSNIGCNENEEEDDEGVVFGEHL